MIPGQDRQEVEVNRTLFNNQTTNRGQRYNPNKRWNQHQKRSQTPDVEVIPFSKTRRNNFNTQPKLHTVHYYVANIKKDKTDRDKEQGRRKGGFQHRNGGGHHNEKPGRSHNNRAPKDMKRKSQLPCKVCSETTHSNLFGCPEFQKYLPGQPG